MFLSAFFQFFKCLSWVGSGLTHKSWIILMLGTFLGERLEFYSEEWQHFLWSELKLRCNKLVCFCQHFFTFFEMLHSGRLWPYSQILDYFDAWNIFRRKAWVLLFRMETFRTINFLWSKLKLRFNKRVSVFLSAFFTFFWNASLV